MKPKESDECHKATFLHLQQHEDVILMYVCHFHRQIMFDLLTPYLLMAYCKVAIVTQVLWCHSEDEICASRKRGFVHWVKKHTHSDFCDWF